MSERILQLEHISYAYPEEALAIDDLNVSIHKGERIAVLGRNGAGKSTFFLLCNGILEPSQGNIYLNGRLLTRRKKDLLELHRQVGIVFQEADNQICAVTVEGEVSFGPMNLRLPMEAVEKKTQAALARMGLEGYESRSPQYLSGGEKKRVTIADILAMEPSLILLDEPTASLDPENVERLEKTLDELTQAGIALAVSTHDVDFAARFAKRGLVFIQGRLMADDSLSRIFSDETLLRQAGLRKPWIWQAAEAMCPGEETYPMTRAQLLRWKPENRR